MKPNACAGKNNTIVRIMCSFYWYFSFKEQATKPVYAELQQQQHLRSEYKDEIDELKNQISFLNEQIWDSTVELEIEREGYNQQISEKDAIILRLQENIKSLKELNTQALAISKFSLKIKIFLLLL